eukprot:g23741.t1
MQYTAWHRANRRRYSAHRRTNFPNKLKAEQLRCAIRRQFEFYFGDVNYPKDNFLRSQADDEGWTPLRFLETFQYTSLLERRADMYRSKKDCRVSKLRTCVEIQSSARAHL